MGKFNRWDRNLQIAILFQFIVVPRPRHQRKYCEWIAHHRNSVYATFGGFFPTVVHQIDDICSLQIQRNLIHKGWRVVSARQKTEQEKIESDL